MAQSTRRRAYGSGSLYAKDGDWYGRWRTPNGRQRAKKIGPARTNTNRLGLSKKEAEAALRAMLSDSAATHQVSDKTTIGELGQTLLATLEQHGRKPSHVESVRYHLRKHIDPLLGELAVADVGEDDVRRAVDALMRTGKAPKTVRNVIGTLHSVLELGVERRLLDRNPCALAKLPRVGRNGSIRFLNHNELGRVLTTELGTDDEISESFPTGTKYGGAQAVRDWWPVVRLLVLTAAMSGMRLGELRALRWEDLDMKAMKIRVRQSFVRGEYGTPKSLHSVRAVPLAPQLVNELDEHHKHTIWNQDHDLVLAHPHTGRPLDRVRLGYHFKAALKRAGVRDVRIHDLRHTFATTVAASGDVSIRTLQEWLGHCDLRTTQIYADYMPSGKESELIGAAFAGAQLGAQNAQLCATEQTQTPVNIA